MTTELDFAAIADTPSFSSVRDELYALGLAIVKGNYGQYRASFTPVSIRTRKAIDAGAFFTYSLNEALRVGKLMAAAYRLGAEHGHSTRPAKETA